MSESCCLNVAISSVANDEYITYLCPVCWTEAAISKKYPHTIEDVRKILDESRRKSKEVSSE